MHLNRNAHKGCIELSLSAVFEKNVVKPSSGTCSWTPPRLW